MVPLLCQFINSNRAVPDVFVETQIWKYEASTNIFTPISISSSSFIPKQEWLFSVLALKLNKSSNNSDGTNNSEYLVVYGGWEQNQFYSFNIETGTFLNLTTIGRTLPVSAGHEAISAQTSTGDEVYMIWSANNQPEFWFYSYDDHSWSSINV